MKANISCSFIERSFFFFPLFACYEPSHFLYLSFSGYYISFFFFFSTLQEREGRKKKKDDGNKQANKQTIRKTNK